MIAFFKILIQIFRSRTLVRITYYNVDGRLLKKYRSRKVAIVYIDGNVVFDNTINKDNFRSWWSEMRKLHEGLVWKRLKRKKGKKIEEKLSIEKVKQIMKKHRIN